MKWLEQQPESDTATLLILKPLRDLAASKRVASFKQKKISDFFKKMSMNQLFVNKFARYINFTYLIKI